MLKLDAEPTFVAKVGIPLPGREPEDVAFTFKHRTKTDYTKFEKECEERKIADVDYVMNVAVAWDLPDAFTPENVARLLENYHGAGTAIALKYVNELKAARLGNFKPPRASSTAVG